MCAAAVCKEGRREGEGMGYDAMAHDASSPSAARDAKKKRVRVGGSLRFEFGCFRLDEMGVLIRGDFFFFGWWWWWWVFLFLQGNRSAKLKQSKLDVRREQWLSLGLISRAPYLFFLFVFPIMFDFGCCWVGPGDLGGGGGNWDLGFQFALKFGSLYWWSLPKENYSFFALMGF